MDNAGHLSQRMLERNSYQVWPVVGALGDGSRKRGFVLDWNLSGSKGNFRLEILILIRMNGMRP